MKKYLITDILWDVEDEDTDENIIEQLELYGRIEEKQELPDIVLMEVEDEEDIVDRLFNIYGFYVSSFKYKDITNKIVHDNL